jgi:hypothetical protein
LTEPRTEILDVPGARLRYDIREAEAEITALLLLMIGLPKDASGFTTLAWVSFSMPRQGESPGAVSPGALEA